MPLFDVFIFDVVLEKWKMKDFYYFDFLISILVSVDSLNKSTFLRRLVYCGFGKELLVHLLRDYEILI